MEFLEGFDGIPLVTLYKRHREKSAGKSEVIHFFRFFNVIARNFLFRGSIENGTQVANLESIDTVVQTLVIK